MTFENGLTISVQIGSGNYCENRSLGIPEDFDPDVPNTSTNAEIAIWDGNQNWNNFGLDIIAGWVSTDDIAIWIGRVKNATSLENI